MEASEARRLTDAELLTVRRMIMAEQYRLEWRLQFSRRYRFSLAAAGGIAAAAVTLSSLASIFHWHP